VTQEFEFKMLHSHKDHILRSHIQDTTIYQLDLKSHW
jgi:hypothetical protein